MFGRIIDECRVQRQRRRHVREFTERVVRSRTGRSALFMEDGPAVLRLPQRRSAYSVWRREAEELHDQGDRMSREGSAWEPHLKAVRSSLDTLRSWLARLTEMFRRDDLVLSWAEEDVEHQPGGRAADDRHSIRAAGDLVPGDRIRWIDDRDGASKIREDLVVGVRPGSTDSGETFEIQEGSGPYVPILVPRPVTAWTLFRGDVHRRPWPDEDMREAMRPEAAGPFSIACGPEGGIAARVPPEARIVPGDRIRWIEMVRSDSPDGTDGARAVVAEVVSVEPGTEPESDRIRFSVLGSTGTEALDKGTELETSLPSSLPGRKSPQVRLGQRERPRDQAGGTGKAEGNGDRQVAGLRDVDVAASAVVTRGSVADQRLHDFQPRFLAEDPAELRGQFVGPVFPQHGHDPDRAQEPDAAGKHRQPGLASGSRFRGAAGKADDRVMHRPLFVGIERLGSPGFRMRRRIVGQGAADDVPPDAFARGSGAGPDSLPFVVGARHGIADDLLLAPPPHGVFSRFSSSAISPRSSSWEGASACGERIGPGFLTFRLPAGMIG